MSDRELRALVIRFASIERSYASKGRPNLIWKRRRLGAIQVFERNFGTVPSLFKGVLPRRGSFYEHAGGPPWPLTPNKALHSDGSRAARENRR